MKKYQSGTYNENANETEPSKVGQAEPYSATEPSKVVKNIKETNMLEYTKAFFCINTYIKNLLLEWAPSDSPEFRELNIVKRKKEST